MHPVAQESKWLPLSVDQGVTVKTEGDVEGPVIVLKSGDATTQKRRVSRESSPA